MGPPDHARRGREDCDLSTAATPSRKPASSPYTRANVARNLEARARIFRPYEPCLCVHSYLCIHTLLEICHFGVMSQFVSQLISLFHKLPS